MISRAVDRLYRMFHFRGTHILMGLAAVVGLATGFGALGFIRLIEYFNSLFFGLTDQVLSEAVGDLGYKFWLPLIPM